MSLIIPSFDSPYSTTPLSAAYGWINLMVLNYATMTGRLRITVNETVDAYYAGKLPVSLVDKVFGDTGGLPTLSNVVADMQGHFDSINGWLYGSLAALDLFPGATVSGQSLNLPDYNSPYSLATVPNAYGWIDELIMDNADYTGSVSLTVHQSEADKLAGKKAIDRIVVELGITPGMPSLGAFIAANLIDFGTVRQYLYMLLAQIDPFAGAAVENAVQTASLGLGASAACDPSVSVTFSDGFTFSGVTTIG